MLIGPPDAALLSAHHSLQDPLNRLRSVSSEFADCAIRRAFGAHRLHAFDRFHFGCIRDQSTQFAIPTPHGERATEPRSLASQFLYAPWGPP